MPRTRADTIPAHTMLFFVNECIALGITAQEYGRRKGLTREQSCRLSSLITERKSSDTNRQTPSASIFTDNHAQSLSRLSNRIVNAMLGSATRAVETLERLNARYEPRTVNGNLEAPEIGQDDRAAYRWAFQTCAAILTLARRDSRDLAPVGPVPTEFEPIARAVEGASPGMLTVIPANGGKAFELSD